MSEMEIRDIRICDNCAWADHFEPREDEIERGLLVGCKRPNFEGYTKKDYVCCFWVPVQKERRNTRR